jgi:DNA mismatch repair protein MutL
MTQIQVLSDELISQIAAGEVVERPASVVKELVDNAIDAGATRILVELEEGGLKKIRIKDNGHGIPAAEVALAFTRHATSKLATVDDLFRIGSLGFRGEALASIASISRVVLRTLAKDERVGTEYEVDGGSVLGNEEVACEPGCDFAIYGLFRHTPARKKYMKQERTEYGHCYNMIVQMALAHPRIGFVLIRDGKQVLELSSGQDLLERARALFGGQTAGAVLPVRYEQGNFSIHGFVGKPELARSSKKYQFVFVNGRPIQSRMIMQAVKQAFHSLLMHEKYPFYILDLVMDPQLVDVNVHPRKLEVKFVNQQEVFRAVMGSVHHALKGALLSPVMRKENPAEMPVQDARPMTFVEAPVVQPQISTPQIRQHLPQELVGNMMPREREHRSFEIRGTRFKPVAQIAHSYIVAEGEEGLVLIDQHAAHERVRYQELMEALEKEAVVSQPLLAPLEMDLGADSARIMGENLEEFAALGFDLQHFGGDTYLLRAVPAGITRREPEQVLRDVLSDLADDWAELKKGNAVKSLREFLLTYTACRGAIKFGDKLTMPEMEALIRDMEKTDNCTHCPHGRPAMVTLTYDKLETLFKRKNF